MPHLILYGFLVVATWMLRRDIAYRRGVSGAIWIPTFWAAIIMSRPLSAWVGFGGSDDPMEGSPLDRLFYFTLITAAFLTVLRRNLSWSYQISKNWPVFLFYGYLLLTVLWADSSVVSFKRWFKDFGNVLIVLAILTDPNPSQAFRAVFVRCAYVLIPLSEIFIRYFPDLGRRYSRHSGGMEALGVTDQKNALGMLVLVGGLVLIWDLFERSGTDHHAWKIDRYYQLAVLLVGAHLLYTCDSKTSILCLSLGAIILASSKLPLLRRRIGAIGGYSLLALLAFLGLDWLFGIKEAIVGSLGRDMTFTGRTDVWRELLALNTDPFIGTGFYSFWTDEYYKARLPEWLGITAHNGYLETYIDGGMIGVSLLILMLLAVALRTNARLAARGDYALICFAVLVTTLIGNFSESHFGRMTPLWFIFLLTSLDVRRSRSFPEAVQATAAHSATWHGNSRKHSVSWLRSV